MYNKSNICITANTLMKKGYTASDAFKYAWKLAKSMISKVSGVSFGKRPAALERLTHYRPDMISVQLIREHSLFDRNAIAVVAAVEGKGSFTVGYVPSEISKVLAPVMDNGISCVKSLFKGIVGGWFEGMNYGMRIALAI